MSAANNYIKELSSLGFVCERKLGQGASGTVFECLDLQTNKVQAVKIVKSTSNGVSSLLELSILLHSDNPYIGKADNVYISVTSVFIFQELGFCTMSEYIKKETIDDDEIKEWMYQMLLGVKYLHDNEIIHCDIKPSNIILSKQETSIIAKLIDFNLSVVKTSEDYMFNHQVGTLEYQAPELLTGAYWNESIDIWALGCTFYEMISGKLFLSRRLTKDVILCSICEWRRSFEDTDNMEVCEKFAQSSFYDLVLSMLSLNQNDRPNVYEILDIVKEPKTFTNYAQHKDVKEHLEYIRIFDELIIELTSHIYMKSDIFSDDLLKIETCLWIACKLLRKTIDKTKLYSRFTDILKLERETIKALDLNVHTLIPFIQ